MKKLIYILLGLFFSAGSFAQEAATTESVKEVVEVTIAQRMGISETALFLIMMFITIILIVVLIVMVSSLKNILKFKIKEGSGSLKMILVLVTLGLTGSAFGQDAVASAESASDVTPFVSFSDTAFWLILLFDGVLVGLIAYVSKTMGSFLTEYHSPIRKTSIKFSWDKAINDAVSIDEEYKIEMDHEYDGIRELDNNLPPWWIYSFYVSIIWAVVYIGYYHVLGMGDLQIAEYEKEVAEAKEKYKVSLDENTVVYVTDEASIAGGKAIFDSKCVICHKPDLGGDIGPNLTDKYWIYGGDVKDVFRTIKYGASNGMQSWASELSPEKMQKVSSYILSLQGTNPEGAKGPEGDLYTPVEITPEEVVNEDIDSTENVIVNDSLTVTSDTISDGVN